MFREITRIKQVDAISADNRVSFCVYDKGCKNEGEWALNISSVIVFSRIYKVINENKAAEIYKQLSLKYTDDIEYIESEIRKFGAATLCYELRPDHISGKIVNES